MSLLKEKFDFIQIIILLIFLFLAEIYAVKNG